MDLITLRGASQPRCKLCNHPQRSEIEGAMMSPGTSLRAIAARFGLGVTNVTNHRPHMAMALDNARAMREVESVGELYKRQLTRSKQLWDAAVKALESPNPMAVANGARLAEVARRYEEGLNKLAQAPGFRDTAPPMQINAPDARIVVTGGETPPD